MGDCYRKSLFVFRRDLRLSDNSALIRALEQSESVLCLFVLDPQLMKQERQAALRFLYQSLLELGGALQQLGSELMLMQGDPCSCIADVARDESIDAVFANKDYSPYSQQRDRKIAEWLDALSVPFFTQPDLLLAEPGEVMKQDGGSYTVFTPYYNRARQLFVASPKPCTAKNFARPGKTRGVSLEQCFSHLAPDSGVHQGGYREAAQLLENIHELAAYDKQRDFPAKPQTSRLSAHLKFGTCSVREVYHRVRQAFGESHGLIRSLFWRDFFYQIAWFYPHVMHKPFREKYESLSWAENDEFFERWCQGMTGYPIVDAGMRELAATGFMHNRVRMITASFLVKHLGINWQRGERWFASRLIDYDAAVNNGNWQWVASTGCDAQPWFRIFNPWLQQKKFDPACDYIRQWVPELASVPAATIHKIAEIQLDNYPSPMVDHRIAVAATKQRYADVNK